MKLVITSGHRTGSRWTHYLFSDITGQDVHPEMGTKWFANSEKREKVGELIDEGKLVKFHGILPSRIYKHFGDKDIKVLAIVRNPRDRAVSMAFHNRYHKNHHFPQKDLPTDGDAVCHTVYKDKLFEKEEKQQFSVMVPTLSTRNYEGDDKDYIWTCYEWLKQDTYREVDSILKSMKLDLSEVEVRRHVAANSFSVKAKRPVGKEDRKDLWRRKGVVNDWENWFTNQMIADTQEDYDRYFDILSKSEAK